MKRILIVEDNDLNLKLFREMLTYGGYEVIEASNGNEGVEKAVRERPDLILMDIQMPGVNGITAIKKMKEMPELKDMPIIAITAYAMSGDRDQFLSRGFTDYIPKPVKISDLLEKVKKYV